MAAVNAQTQTSQAIIELFYNDSGLFATWDFWKYFFLGLQEDQLDNTSDCFDAFTHFEELYKAVYALTSDRTDYDQGIQTKGNGLANALGFWFYSALHVGDVIIDSVEVYENCKVDYQMLSFGKSVTSVSGALNTLTSFLWRQFSTEQSDMDLYKKISQAVTDKDPINAGSGFGQFWALLFMAEIPSKNGANDNYEIVASL